jgi:hypothetical protein
MAQMLLELKSLVRRVLGIPDPWKKFRRFQARIHPETWSRQEAVVHWLEKATASPPTEEQGADPVVRRGQELKREVLSRFQGRYAGRTDLRVLLLGYSFGVAPAGWSLFRNLADGLRWSGVAVAFWEPADDLARVLEAFRPTVFLANDPEEYEPQRYLDYLDWRALAAYRKENTLKLGLVANPYPKAPAALTARLRHARRLGVDFYYSFQAPSFIAERYAGYQREGYSVCSLEFGANPLVYYPVAGVERDLPFVFLGSAHFEKWDRYCDYFQDILAIVPGVIVGPGWKHALRQQLPEAQHRYLYARARVGLNLHVPFQIAASSELNERTYNLAAAGVPQLVDNPPLLPERFTPDCFYVASSSAEYAALFRRLLERPEEARARALSALEQVFARHTIFHRVEAFVGELTDRVLSR